MRAGLPRRLAAMFYDGLLLGAVLMIATALLLPLTGGEAITPADHPWLGFAYRLVIVGLVVLFFGTFWTRRGQTLGMASWRLRVEREDDDRLDLPRLVMRFDQRRVGDLFHLIRAINALGSAPLADAGPDPA